MSENQVSRSVITRVLLTFGLLEDVDFRVKTLHSDDGTAIGTLVNFHGDVVRDVVMRNADRIEELTTHRKSPFHVSIRYPYPTRPDVPQVDVSNYGTRVRETPRNAR